MSRLGPKGRRDEREKAARVTKALAALTPMTTAELAVRFEDLTGQRPRSRNRGWLHKRVAWHIQAAEYGGLTAEDLAKIDELIPVALRAFETARSTPKRPSRGGPVPAVDQRDRRIPPPGTVIRRECRGVPHEVLVTDQGFQHEGVCYRSLSAVAKVISGTPWNGFVFFRLPAEDQNGEERAA